MAAVDGYDDTPVTLADGLISVDDVMVAGSRSFIRDPRLSRLADSTGRLKSNRALRTHLPALAATDKWCCSCGSIRPKSYFSPRKDTFDKLDPRCKLCENERKRKRYRDMIGNRPVRKYAHKTPPAPNVSA